MSVCPGEQAHYPEELACLAAALAKDLKLHQLDAKTAFLDGGLKETIYMQQPDGHVEGGRNMVCPLRKRTQASS